MTRLAPIQADIAYWKVPQLKDSYYAAIPWEEHIEIWKNYSGSNQTAERIAERGWIWNQRISEILQDESYRSVVLQRERVPRKR